VPRAAKFFFAARVRVEVMKDMLGSPQTEFKIFWVTGLLVMDFFVNVFIVT